jgi:hypothetical protein
MKTLFNLLRLSLAVGACVLFAAPGATAQLAPNQTNGFGNKKLVTFTYNQTFDCVDQPTMDLDFNKIPAESDPNEMQTPICQPVTEPTEDPTGRKIEHTAHLYVLVSIGDSQRARPDWTPNRAGLCADTQSQPRRGQ